MPDSPNKSAEVEKDAAGKDAAAKVPVNKETMRQAARVFLYLLPYKRKFFTSLAFLLVSSTLSLAFPYLIGKMLDGTQPGAGPGGIVINRVALMLMGVLGTQALFSFFLFVVVCAMRPARAFRSALRGLCAHHFAADDFFLAPAPWASCPRGFRPT